MALLRICESCLDLDDILSKMLALHQIISPAAALNSLRGSEGAGTIIPASSCLLWNLHKGYALSRKTFLLCFPLILGVFDNACQQHLKLFAR